MLRLFALFTVNYGGLWSARFRDGDAFKVGVAEWLRQLAHLHVEEVAEGYRRSIRLFLKGPPSIGQFIEVCRHPSPAHQRWLLPPAPPSAGEDSPGYQGFLALRQLLRGRRSGAPVVDLDP